ncbi:MAG TPA: nucleotidyl transferase AbiEii/AbiGii toxin family protein [Saprospiraceae bacterium]|nr:nucleotidyl transferase AbiEii/AbiGii toxin family protein [Saprospiraceae bacterium]
MSPDPKIIKDVAFELGVSPSLIEKDWYATQVLKAISEFNYPQMEAIFAGGTSLSKSYDLIKRFSEDLDFKVQLKNPILTRSDFKKYREELLKAVVAVEDIRIKPNSLESRNGSRFFSVLLNYPQKFEASSSLRPEIKLEFSFINPHLPVEVKSIASFISSFTRATPEAELQSISPIETAADKFCALTWRVLNQNRKNEDPTFIRHLHDLCKLTKIIEAKKDLFINLIKEIHTDDFDRGSISLSLKEAAKEAHRVLSLDNKYSEEYSKFALGMSYESNSEKQTFNQALNAFLQILNFIKE